MAKHAPKRAGGAPTEKKTGKVVVGVAVAGVVIALLYILTKRKEATQQIAQVTEQAEILDELDRTAVIPEDEPTSYNPVPMGNIAPAPHKVVVK